LPEGGYKKGWAYSPMSNFIRNLFSKKKEINAGWALFAYAFYYIGYYACGLLAIPVAIGLSLTNPNYAFTLDYESLHRNLEYFPICIL
jgi:hypothetical protein